MDTMQPVVVKIGDGEPVTAQNPDSHDVVVQVGDMGSRDARSHVSVLVGQAQIVVSVWDGATVRGTWIDRTTGKVTDAQ